MNLRIFPVDQVTIEPDKAIAHIEGNDGHERLLQEEGVFTLPGQGAGRPEGSPKRGMRRQEGCSRTILSSSALDE
jgi:hypothetical protein